jgi:hypothetical protein
MDRIGRMCVKDIAKAICAAAWAFHRFFPMVPCSIMGGIG